MAEIIPIIAGGHHSNIYIIKDEVVAVIDTGLGGDGLLRRIKEVVNPEDVDLIINTHAHADHVLGNPLFKGDVLIHENDAQALSSGELYSTSLLFGKSQKLKYTRTLKNGEKLNLGELEIEVVHTPGHTMGSICLYIGSLGALFSGDTVFAGGNFGRTDLGGDPNELKNSLRKIEKLDVEVLYPGHEKIVEEKAAQHIAMAVEFAEEFL